MINKVVEQWANSWVSSGRMDAVMWGACGVEAACVYALQYKCKVPAS